MLEFIYNIFINYFIISRLRLVNKYYKIYIYELLQ